MKSNEFKIVNSEEFNVKNKKKKTGIIIATGVIVAAILAIGAIFMLSGRNKLEGKWTVIESGTVNDNGGLAENLYSMAYSTLFGAGTQVEFTKDDMIIMGGATKYKYKDNKLELTNENGRSIADAVINDNGQLVMQINNYQVILVKADKAGSAGINEKKISDNAQSDTKTEGNSSNSSQANNDAAKENTDSSTIFSGKTKFEVISADLNSREPKVTIKVINNSDKQISLFANSIEIEDNGKNVTNLDMIKQLQNGGAEFSVFANEEKKFTFYFNSLEEAKQYNLKIEQIWCNDPLYLNERAEVKLK